MKSPTVSHSNGVANNSKVKNLMQIDLAKRSQMIAISAYFRAEQRGFTPNQDLEDWLESEREVDRQLSAFSS